MEELIRRANDLKNKLDAYRPFDKDLEGRIMQKFKLDWNFHSNNIEGNSLTYGETKALILHGITAQGKPLKDHFEITGHNEAIEWILDIVKGDRPITESFIRQFHEILLKEPYEVDAITPDGKPTKKTIQVGKYKSTPNHVKTKTGELFFFASVEETPAKMEELIAWYRENEAKLDPIILAAEFHYRFIRIHPFDDGNGRVARLLMNFILMKKNYAPVIIRTEDKENYFSALQQADVGMINPFIKYIAQNLIYSLSLMLKAAKGEGIDDSDDGLKEFKLMQARLQRMVEERKRKTEYDFNRLNEMVDEVTLPILTHIDTAFLKQVKDLLGRAIVAIHFGDTEGKPNLPDSEKVPFPYDLDWETRMELFKSSDCNYCHIQYAWASILGLPDISAEVKLDLEFIILDSGVSIKIKKSPSAELEIFAKDVTEPLSKEILEKFNSVLLSAAVAQIDKHLPK